MMHEVVNRDDTRVEVTWNEYSKKYDVHSSKFIM